jgi:adenine deaminase
MTDLPRLLAVARGDAEPDLVIEATRSFDAFTREWLDGDIAVAQGRIAGIGSFPTGGERVDGRGRFVVPGLIDAHMHIESSKLSPAEFARVVVPRGVTSVICDPHELANVLGPDGVHWLLDATEGLPLRVFVMASSCVPASGFETAYRAMGPGDIEAILRRDRALGVAEMMNFPGVIAGDPDVLATLAARGATHVDGHAPGVHGRALDAYAAAGIRSDHESTTWEEALQKRRRGMWVLLREASNARNLRALLELVRRHGPDYCALCTDDTEPTDLLRDGSVDHGARIAMAEGIAVEDVLAMATLHAARCHHLDDLGAVAPGFRADLLLVEDPRTLAPSHVWRGGELVARDGVAVDFAAPAAPAFVRGTVRPAPVSAADLALADPGTPRVRVIGLVPGQIVTEALTDAPTRRDGLIVADPARDLAKIAVVERHHRSGNVGVGLVRGFGLRAGAFASTVAHDAHNIVVVGADDASMLACVQRLAQLGGGVAVARDGAVVGELALPIAGLLSEEPAEVVVRTLEGLEVQLARVGVHVDTPFMALSFLALSVIPALKLTDQGLVDVERFALVGLGAP